MIIRSAEEKDFQTWQLFLEKFPASISHDFRWFYVIKNTFNHDPIYLIAEENNQITGILPVFLVNSFLFGKSLISIPYLNSGYSITESKNISDNLILKTIEYQKQYKTKYIELRSTEKTSITSFHEKQHKVTFILELNNSSEEMFKLFSAKLRSQIRRPIKSGAKAKVIPGNLVTSKDIDNFYRIFSIHYRELGTPIYPKKLFTNVFDNFRESALLSFVEINNQLTSTAITIIKQDTAEIIWAASLKEYHKDSVNMLLYWKTIEELIDRKIKFFDFGRCSYDSGGYQFKKQWGGIEKKLYWYYHSNNYVPDINPKNSKFSLLTKIWKKLPISICNFLGPFLTKHLP